MSLLRVSLVAVQAIGNQLACTPPNPTQSQQRYQTEDSEPYILQLAPLVFKIHQFLIWLFALGEALFYLNTLYPLASISPAASTLICPVPQPNVHASPLFVIGVIAVLLGSYIRLDCFRTLGKLFTFDLTVHPKHKLVTARFYGYVRHPAYTGSLLLVAGLAFSHLTQGSWATECGPLRAPGSALMVWAAWWCWTLTVGVSRAEAEDKQMRKLFKEEWEAYAVNVPWWFLPGFI